MLWKSSLTLNLTWSQLNQTLLPASSLLPKVTNQHTSTLLIWTNCLKFLMKRWSNTMRTLVHWTLCSSMLLCNISHVLLELLTNLVVLLFWLVLVALVNNHFPSSLPLFLAKMSSESQLLQTTHLMTWRLIFRLCTWSLVCRVPLLCSSWLTLRSLMTNSWSTLTISSLLDTSLISLPEMS